MCGIVGYIGHRDPKQVIMSGLKVLEYRGYDSAGVAILNGNKFERVRAEGKLTNLSTKLDKLSFDGKIGIGHTRWATHGGPVEKNAHPHTVGSVSLVHNGIIENYSELREVLVQQGAVIESDTDSELVAHLIDNSLKKSEDLYQAIQNVIPQIKGAYAIVAVSSHEPKKMVAFKNGPPLVVGIGDKEVLVASDVQAILPYTQQICFLNDQELVCINDTDVKLFDFNFQSLVPKFSKLKWTPEDSQKSGYAHYMLKEIFEQPRAVAQAMGPHINLLEKSIRLNRIGFHTPLSENENLDTDKDWQNTSEIFKSIERVFIVACGSSYYAGMVGEYLIEKLAKIPIEVDVASEFRYRFPVIPKNSLLITISQSGETADTLAAIRLAKELGALTLSICNVKNSSIDREAHGHLYMNAGTEVGVASTKAFAATLTLMGVLALSLSQAKGTLDSNKLKKYIDEMLLIPNFIEKILAYNSYFSEASNALKRKKGFLYLGRGVHFPIALEGALKLKELAYMHAEGYPAGEMKHGPLALIDQDMAVVTIVPKDELFEKTLSNLEEAKARGGKIIAIGTGEDEKLKALSEHYISLPETSWIAAPLIEVIPIQLLAYHVAVSLGHDVDQPRNLAKSVTVE